MPRPRVGLLLLPLLAASALVAPNARAQSFGAPPFEAWVSAESMSLVPTREKLWPSLGVVRYGDRVRVTGCVPSCDRGDAWAMLEPFGAIRLSALSAGQRPAHAAAFGPEARFRYGRVVRRDIVSRAERDATSAIVDRFGVGDEIVLAVDQPYVEQGFLVRPDGSYLPATEVMLFTPSEFAGWPSPPRRFVFAMRATTLTLPDGTTRPVAQYERFTYLGEGNRVVRVEGGSLPYYDVRTGRTRRRPPRVPATAKWVHVDLRQQVLTAYEGDTLVFATLISAGKHEGTTQTGHFRVVRKLVYTTMKAAATREDSYFVEGVRAVQYFHGSVAFHMAYWHDRFGTPMSHGCVNLSPRDSEWLFGWTPGEVPDGWRGLDPISAGVESLYVRVERAPR